MNDEQEPRTPQIWSRLAPSTALRPILPSGSPTSLQSRRDGRVAPSVRMVEGGSPVYTTAVGMAT